MKFLDFLTDQIVEERDSPINGRIKVVKKGRDYRIEVAGLLQSGGLVKNIWQAGLKQVKHKVKNCLILGLGGGTAAQLVSQKWPEAKIVGIEIDPAMIELAKKYFGVGLIPNLEVIEDDAFSWLRKELREFEALNHVGFRVKFDLIIVDLYVGEKFPEEAESEEFLENLKSVLAPNGVIIFNRLFWGEKKKEVGEFVKKLENHFAKISLKRTPCNLLIFVLFDKERGERYIGDNNEKENLFPPYFYCGSLRCLFFRYRKTATNRSSPVS